MIFSIHALSNNTRLLDNPDIFPHDNLFLYIKKKDELTFDVFVCCEEVMSEKEVNNLLWHAVADFKRFNVSKKDLKMYLTDTLHGTPMSLFRLNDKKGLFNPYLENLYVDDFPKSEPTLTREELYIKRLEETIDKLISSKN